MQTAERAVAAAGARALLAALMLRRAVWTALVVLHVLMLCSQAEALTATGLRFGPHGKDGMRIVVELDRRTRFSVDAVKDPPRLILDLPQADFDLPKWVPEAPPLAKGFRFGQFDTARSRLVVDMTAPFKVTQNFLLPPADGSRSFRLVIDVARTEAMPPPGAPGGAAVAAVTPPDRQVDAPPVEGSSGKVTPAPQGPIAPKPRKKPLIILDPGHGGVDPGTHGVNGTDEKVIVLRMGLQLRRALLATGRYRVAMTRDRDVFVPLRDRIEIAHERGGDLFISLHADSNPHSDTAGLSVYTLSDKASDVEAAKLAAQENQADILAGADLSYQDPVVAGILLDLSQRGTMNSSIDFADDLVRELGDVTNLLRRTRRFAGFVVLKSPDIPSVLIELGYLSNRRDAKKLVDATHRARLCGAIVRAVDQHFGFGN